MRTYIRFEEIPDLSPDEGLMEVTGESGEFDVTDMTEEQRKKKLDKSDRRIDGREEIPYSAAQVLS